MFCGRNTRHRSYSGVYIVVVLVVFAWSTSRRSRAQAPHEAPVRRPLQSTLGYAGEDLYNNARIHLEVRRRSSRSTIIMIISITIMLLLSHLRPMSTTSNH